MHVLRTILRPGWIALGLVVAAFAVACFTLLAPWQLGKNSDTERRNDLIRTATSIETAPLAEVAPSSTFVPSSEWRSVAVTGRYLTDRQALVRLRNVDQRPAVEVLTPFAVSGSDRVILVNRGFVRPVEGAVPDIPAPPAGEQTVDGRIRAAESVSTDRGTRVENGALTVATINPGLVSAATSTPMDDFYLQLSPDQPGSLGEIPLPQLDTGPYLSYGLQWLAFGVMAPLGVGYFLYSEIRARRRAAAAATETSATAAAGTAVDQPSDPVAAATTTVESRSQRRQHRREELRAAAGTTVTQQVGDIGHGPRADDESSDVRDKLTRRYGG
ncbi:SURF1 family cytochrome oxidase biogenesis protein [Gordonia sp. AC31]|uniref:SURF1 family cytochrome oxidase biogenesis protein n=1 Tax=Gordonia sp. AC31 TaxID=2962571 RepID=UPI002882A44D|nr:SURF1 family cytochrome oxidase biogenesis protein [Gordonia sp. AC31]MDT0219562.1 SURF1 family cytochrome oxidase biogenesis protein [Gordonia sp. AC31]